MTLIKSKKYAQVAFPLTSFQNFTYSIPEDLINQIKIGSCVKASIRRKERIGFVVQITDRPYFKGKIIDLNGSLEKDLSIPDDLWLTIKWISYYYFCSIGKVIKAAIPLSFKNEIRSKEILYIKITQLGLENIEILSKKSTIQKKILILLSKKKDYIRLSELKIISSSIYSICRKLSQMKYVVIIKKNEDFNKHRNFYEFDKKHIELNLDQKKVYQQITDNFKYNKFSVSYIHGVTGSGKTEVYIKLTENILTKNKTVIILVPEIALTSQISLRFKSFFGNKIATWHSRLTASEKFNTWKEIKRGVYSVIIGARSALFTPMKDLGLIIIDEEHDQSFKQDRVTPYYHARNTALMRAKFAGIPIVMGSATPSMEMYYQKITKNITWTKIKTRYANASFPEIKIVDMMAQMKKSEDFNSYLSVELRDAIKNCLNRNEQVILMLNQRGFSKVQQCSSCGEIINCKNCSVSLKFHKKINKLVCHYCDFKTNILQLCRFCNSSEMQFLGTGTQRVEEDLLSVFPGLNILRMDIDSVNSVENSHHSIIKKFENREAEILLGTQMIAKGLDFPNVTLVGILNADVGLFMPDYRASERTFQLIYQVIGRSGRHQKSGKALIQTFNPNEISIVSAANQNLKSFYNIILAERNELFYPPFSRLSRFVCLGSDKTKVKEKIYFIYDLLRKNKDFKILGPSIAPIEKINNLWRYHILIKYDLDKPHALHRNFSNQISSILNENSGKIKVQLDVDPLTII